MQKLLEDGKARARTFPSENIEMETPTQKSKKVFPDSPLFKQWGDNLSEDDQREAQALFEKYGYNVFLSDRLPLDRALSETRDPRYMFIIFRPFIQVHTCQMNTNFFVC